ncbi:hypothetical protein ACHAWF_015755 [Thalassiosira exigua]
MIRNDIVKRGVFIFLCTVASAPHCKSQTPNQDVVDAVKALQSFGIGGLDDLCHPLSNEFAPIITQCSDPKAKGNLVNGQTTQHAYIRKRRLVENQELGRGMNFYAFNIAGATISIIIVAVISAIFLGFLTLDPSDLRVKIRAAIDPAKREAASAVFALVDQNHRLLYVTCLLVFGEIIPSAIFTGPEQLILASNLASLVSISMRMLHPITYSLVKLLDALVPEDSDPEEYNRDELSALVRIQYEGRVEAERQQELANSVHIDNVTVRMGNHSRFKRQNILHMANQITAEKRRHHEIDHFNSTRSWRRLKEEIMHAVAEKSQSSNEISLGILDGLMGGSENAREGSADFSKGSHRRTPSSSSGPPCRRHIPCRNGSNASSTLRMVIGQQNGEHTAEGGSGLLPAGGDEPAAAEANKYRKLMSTVISSTKSADDSVLHWQREQSFELCVPSFVGGATGSRY